MALEVIDRRSRPSWLELETEAGPDGFPIRRYRVAPAPGRPPRGSLFFQTGRADFIEKYIETLAHWRGRGWSVEGFDWRGQGGSGRFLKDRTIGHSPPFDIHVTDLAERVASWKARTPGPHYAIGHSMGGHLTLRMLVDAPGLVDRAVLVSPMMGIRVGLIGERVASVIASLACRAGLAERAVWSTTPEAEARRQTILTHSPERFADEMWWRQAYPELDLGPPSWGWLVAAWTSIAALRRPGVLEGVETPALILCSERDRLVSSPEMLKVAARLPHARLRASAAVAHEVLREEDSYRIWGLAEIDEFLEAQPRS